MSKMSSMQVSILEKMSMACPTFKVSQIFSMARSILVWRSSARAFSVESFHFLCRLHHQHPCLHFVQQRITPWTPSSLQASSFSYHVLLASPFSYHIVLSTSSRPLSHITLPSPITGWPTHASWGAQPLMKQAQRMYFHAGTKSYKTTTVPGSSEGIFMSVSS